MSGSVWPYDTFQEPEPRMDDRSIRAITCFVISPFKPRERWDDMFKLFQSVASEVSRRINVPIECRRADQIVSSGMLHSEIWNSLRTADFIICDVSNQNGNVMLELGVAAAWRKKEQIIILRDKNDEKPFLFDINPARHIEYELSFSGYQKLVNDLIEIVEKVLATFPFHGTPGYGQSISLPFRASLNNGIDLRELYTEDITHRVLLPDCLEFGAPLNYRYSWMSLGDRRLSRVHVKAELKMTLQVPHLAPFMGIMVRGQNYFTNFGHFIFAQHDGTIYLTIREDDTGKHHNEPLGKIAEFDMRKFIGFDVSIDDDVLKIQVEKVVNSKKLGELPYVFSAGRIYFIAGYCRIGIRNIEIDEL